MWLMLAAPFWYLTQASCGEERGFKKVTDITPLIMKGHKQPKNPCVFITLMGKLEGETVEQNALLSSEN